MGCTASKDGVGSVRRSRPAQTGRSMSMPVQATGNSDNGYHMVALTSSTYGILKTDSSKKDGMDVNSSIANSAQDAFYQKLKNFDVPDEMVTKPWSEVSRNLLQVPPAPRTDSSRRMDSRRRLDSPRQTRGIDSPRQRGSFRRTDSPRRLSSQAARNDHETINMWELMDGLEEDGTVKPKLKLVEKIPRSPAIKPYERSITFSTIHTLSELDSGDPSQAITPGPANNDLNNLISGDVDGKEIVKSARVICRSMCSPVVPKRDEITVKLTPSSPRLTVPRSDSPRPLQQSVSPMMPTPEENALIQEVSKVLLAPPSPAPRVAVRSSDSPCPRPPSISPMIPTPEANATIQEVSEALFARASAAQRVAVWSTDLPQTQLPSASPMTPALEANATAQEVSNSLLPPPSPSLRGAVRSGARQRPGQSSVPSVTLQPEANAKIREANKVLPRPSPSLTITNGTKDATGLLVRNRPPGLQPSKFAVVKAINSPMSLNNKLEAEIERAMSEDRGVSKSCVQSPAKRSLEPDFGRVRAVAASLLDGAAGVHSQQTPRWVDAKESSNQATSRQIPRFASPIHVLSLAASFDLESRENSTTHSDLKRAPLSPSPAIMKAGGGRPSFSKQQSMPRPVLRAIPSSGQGVSLQSQVSSPSHSRHWSLDESANARVAQVLERGAGTNAKRSLGGTAIDSDPLPSFEEVLEMFSAEEWYTVKGCKSEATAVPGETEKNGKFSLNGLEGVPGNRGEPGNGNKGASIHVAGQGEAFATASNGVPGEGRVTPDPWARFEKKCPSVGEDRVVLYTTSLRGIRKTFEDCNNARLIFQSFNVEIDERDVSIHAEFRQELRELSEKPVPVPQALIKGRYIGGLEMITQLHEDGTLGTLVGDLPPQLSRGECDGCGGVRFVPCSDCSGSTKIVNEAKEVVRCSECNENGLMRCPICY